MKTTEKPQQRNRRKKRIKWNYGIKKNNNQKKKKKRKPFFRYWSLMLIILAIAEIRRISEGGHPG
jgi:hypothetical protein